MLPVARRLPIFITTVCLMLLLGGCVLRPYRVSVQQGNLLPSNLVAKVRPGMSRQAVINLLGTPLLNNIYADNTLVYAYSFKPGYGPIQRKVLAVHFNRANRVSRVQTHLDTTSLPEPS